MGIESDQLVFDYLSRVGDLAQQRQLTSGDRMRLVSALRGEIDRQRSKAIGGPDSSAAVQRILGRLGTPDEIVDAADGGGVEAVLSARTSRKVPRQRRTAPGGAGRAETPVGFGKPTGFGKPVGFEKGDAAPPSSGPSSPHVAGTDELGSGDADWWRTEPGPFGGLGTAVPGFTGGVEIPEILRPPEEDEEDSAKGPGKGPAEGEAEPEGRRRWIPAGLRRRRAGVPVVEEAEAEGGTEEPVRAPLVPRGSPFLLLAAALLVAGAVAGNLLLLLGGWFLTYVSRRLSRAEAKWAAIGLPGVVLVGGAVWLWGRTEGKWGAPLSLQAEGAMGEALTGLWPVLMRVAAVASALFVVWRARRMSP
ncbi:hypothetical protein OG897_03155 [Streptomyces sp. NBC_00237]|uniref:hypothetical protein n=1 Tax=Streptomyces sp. NBC_00237 TaxID=2975687 RepID=UPI0022548198|nr:hypothetical protein [Streptomyces sp. NBC_00237]MCX5200463.1 hypothetical protein [Streptomyces sp. NBC_00237]